MKALRQVGVLLIIGALFIGAIAFAQEADVRFFSVVLGCGGGPREDNVSGYMLWPAGSTEEAVFLDAGTLTVGIRKAEELGNLWDFVVPSDSNLTREGWVLQNAKAYLISHAHLDHILALVINSPVDSKKDIMGIDSTIDHLANHVFNWEIWPNFGDEGPGFPLGVYHYVRLVPDEEVPISGTSMTVEPFVLSHSEPYQSTAFLIRDDGYYVLYFGDTGPDKVEGTDNLKTVWERIAPLVSEGKLLGMFLEVSYVDATPDKSLFGHLTPSWMMNELHVLAELVDPDSPDTALEGFKVVINHIKPVFKVGPTPASVIAEELAQLNDLGVEFIIPYQGMRLGF